MEAFYYANHNSQIFDAVSTPGHRLVGELQLEPGHYVVFAKADVGTNVAGGYPPPPWPHGGGVISLSFGGVHDQAYTALKPESGDNIENISVMVAGEITRSRRARLFFINPYPLRSVVNAVRMIAIRVDNVTTVTVGTDVSGVPDESEINFALWSGVLGRRISRDEP